MDISIIIPTFKRPGDLKRCLETLFQQDYPLGRYEVIIVDDGVDSRTKDVVVGLQKGHSSLRYQTGQGRGPAHARNLGIDVARGAIVGFVDDDCLLGRGWIRAMVEAHRKHPGAGVVGGLTTAKEESVPVLIGQALSTWSIEAVLGGNRTVLFFPTCNVSCKKNVLEQYRFDERFRFPGGEDLDFFWRLFKSGLEFIWDKDIRVVHDRRGSLRDFMKQAYAYGRGNFLVQYFHRDHPLLKELKTGAWSFWAATLVNILKIPRFSFFLGRRLIREHRIGGAGRKLSVYLYFVWHKIFYILGNIAEFFAVRKRCCPEERLASVPRLLILDITHDCNLTCRICEIWKTKGREKDMDLSLVRKALREAKALSIKEIALSGGESLLRSDILDIFHMARSLGIKDLGVLTNGVLVAEHWEKWMPYLLDATISLVMSFDSLRPDVHNRIRNSDIAWQRTREGLALLSSLKKGHPHVRFNIITVICDQNLEELAAIADFAYSLGADSLQFQPLLANNLNMAQRTASLFWVSEGRWAALDEAVDGLVALKKKRPGFIKNSVENLGLTKKYFRGCLSFGDVGCFSADETVLVSNRGECTTCFSSYGHIGRQSLRDILGSRARAEAFRELSRCAWPCLLPCFCDKTDRTV